MAPQQILSPDSATSAAAESAEPQKPSASTGPKTAEGKAKSSQNAFKHGLASATLLVADESAEEWETFLQSLHAEWSPATPTEELLVGDMAKHHWLKDRAIRIQNELLQDHGTFSAMVSTPFFPILLRYQTTNERAFARAKKQLEDMQNVRREFVSQNHPDPIAVAQRPAPKSVKQSAPTERVQQPRRDLVNETSKREPATTAAAGITIPTQLKLVQKRSAASPRS